MIAIMLLTYDRLDVAKRTLASIAANLTCPEDIWMHYAAANVQSTRPDGSPNPLAMPETYEEARKRLGRIVIISAMLAVNPVVYSAYAHKIEAGDEDPFDYYSRTTGEVGKIIDRAIGKCGLSLMGDSRAVVPMTGKNTGTIIERTRNAYNTGRYHGPCNNHWPQNSVAVLTGLLRFGINRLPFRDEVWDKDNVRLFGRYASIVIFDDQAPAAEDGVQLLDKARLDLLKKVNDYSVTDEDTASQRYCTYNMSKKDGSSICGKCIDACPSNALANSSPSPQGEFSEKVSQQKHRFYEGTVDFDFGNCCRDRDQKAQVYDEYVCARCEAICAVSGIRKKAEAIKTINT